MEITNFFKNNNLESKKNKIQELLNVDLFTDNRNDLVKVTGFSYDEVDGAVIEFQDLQRKIVAKQFNHEDCSEELEKQNDIVSYLMGEQKEEERKLAS